MRSLHTRLRRWLAARRGEVSEKELFLRRSALPPRMADLILLHLLRLYGSTIVPLGTLDSVQRLCASALDGERFRGWRLARMGEKSLGAFAARADHLFLIREFLQKKLLSEEEGCGEWI